MDENSDSRNTIMNRTLPGLLLICILALFAPIMPTASAACSRYNPVACGQVRIGGDGYFYDNTGRWAMRGIAFFLPQFGINGRTFHDTNYASAIADGSLDAWLNQAAWYLGANLLRNFVDLPYRNSAGAVITPTSHATLLDYAERANARGMRLGLVLHNSADWAMTPERAAWISGLIDSFAARGMLPIIAYLSADNEINNHCSNGGFDCFDNLAGYNARPYIDGALEWTAQFRSVVKARAPQLPITVGITTELRDGDNTRAAFNFFRSDSRGRTLASLVDFLAPHNFGGGAAGVIDDIRFQRYTRPVVLEEFGFPSDPFPRNRLWTEGAQRCRVAPHSAECFETAPFFVEENIRALRTRSYAGGVAWMLADIREKNGTNACTDPTKPFDLWTGIIAIGGSYCDGGTYSRNPGQPKATGVRICYYYTGNLTRCDGGVMMRLRAYLPTISR
ncbi:MAG TPA: hypothetical protein PKA05_00555 [Roseiflexaceae bacterium]|nr:hypothetical protein [Roseiflexaceae bacterium]HMP38846.1 hypothetical protein [Roseiflexaceae bacterium]